MTTDEVLIVHLVKDDIRQESLCGAPILHNKNARVMKFCSKCHNILLSETMSNVVDAETIQKESQMQEELVVHMKHFRTGFPVCWLHTRTGMFDGTWDPDKVTCTYCIDIID